MNLATALVGLVVLAALAAVAVSLVRSHKRGGGCGCGCEHCAGAGLCHPAAKKSGKA